jgi:hypothetical protein
MRSCPIKADAPTLSILPFDKFVDPEIIAVVFSDQRPVVGKLTAAASAIRFPIANKDDEATTGENLGGLVYRVAFFERATKRDFALARISTRRRDKAASVDRLVDPHLYSVQIGQPNRSKAAG